MYERDISRRDPGCVVFLLDRSDSMKSTWVNSQETLAQGAARVLNEILLELLFTSQGEPGKARHYFDIGIFGYGLRPVAGGEGVEPAFGGKLAGQPLVALPDLRDNPIAVRETPSVDIGAPPSRVPVWVEPVHGYRTPMCQAVAVAGAHVYEWANAHPDSFPPIIINITDGMVTDSPYEGASLEEWAQRLVNIQTSDGPTLFFNIFLTPAASNGVLFPATDYSLPEPGPQLFRISSLLPPPMIANAQSTGTTVEPGARGFGFNAGATTAYDPVRWVDQLVRSFAPPTGGAAGSRLPRLEPAAMRTWFAEMQDKWAAEVRDFDSIIEERKFAEVGSFATLLGFDIYGLDGPEPYWRGVALGDTVLFHVRAGHLIAAFPPMGPDDFGTLPDGVHTSPASLDRMTGRLLTGGGVLEAGDFLFAATDAMAQWILRTRSEERRV